MDSVDFFLASGLCLLIGLFLMVRAWRANHHTILLLLSLVPIFVGVIFSTLAIASVEPYWAEKPFYLIVFHLSILGVFLYQLSNKILNNEVRRDS